jgi:hypothetical protein
MRSWLLVVLAASACGGTEITNVYVIGGADAAADTPDAAQEGKGSESGSDVVAEVAPDVTPDVSGDIGLDVTFDVTPDDAPDVTPDVGQDVASDVALEATTDAPVDAREAGVIPVGQPCTTDYDCLSSACDSLSLTCVVSQCNDNRVDGAETDVDCGGPVCPVCATGKVCKVDGDCSTSACDAYAHVCITNACLDHTKDSTETDVDCGGSCPACALGKGCLQMSDCASDVCDALMHVCISSTCEDHVKDGSETDVDCGGSCCYGGATGCCAPGEHCTSNFDCAGGLLCDSSKMCQ